MKRLILVSIVLTGVGCATSRKVIFSAEATPVKAMIEVNGVTLCDSTPCEITLQCSEQWVGLANSSTGLAPTSGEYRVVASPLEKPQPPQRYYTSIKFVNPCQVMRGMKPALNFRMDIEPIVPSQTLHVN